jgi:hypothetical protein
MSRTYSAITWGLALIVAALVLNWQQSIPWAMASAGAIAVIGGAVVALMDADGKDAAKRAAREQAAEWAAKHPRA